MQGVVVHADTAVLQSYERKYDTPKPNLSQYSIIIYAFTTPGMAPEWVTDTKGVHATIVLPVYPIGND